MADCFVRFSCLLHVGSAENAARAEQVRGAFAADLDRDGLDLGFDMQVDHESGPGALWIHSDECGEPDHVIAFVLRCAEELGLTGFWGFCWSLSCSKRRIDGFGGGTHVLDLDQRKSVADFDCHAFLQDRLSAGAAALDAAPTPPRG